MRQTSICLLFLFSLSFMYLPAYSKDANGISDDATKIVNDVFGDNSESIPKWLLDKAQAVLVIPDFNENDEQNQGIFSVRTSDDNWSLPSMANVATTGSLSDDAKSIVILFMKGKGSDNLRKGNAIVSGNGIKPGPSGNVNENDFNQPDNDIVYVYSIKDKKATGAALQQAAVTSDNDANKELYNKDTSVDQIINKQIDNPPDKAVQFQATLNNQSSAK